ncbi:MAG TPA: SurA N-terminal domain-containing protein [Candidatus Eisenbacteria bacterium]
MMQGLRDNMKLIIWITAIVFLVGFGILQLGGVFDTNRSERGPNGVIAEINGEPIRLEDFNQTYNMMVRQLQQQRELQPGEDSYVREQAWQTIVRNTLMMQEAHHRGISATPEEIKTAIRVAPPQFLTQAPGFQTNGQFDYRKYLSELDNPNSQVPWAQVEAIVAQNLPVEKLQEDVVAAAKVSDGDVRDRFLLQNDKLTARFVQFAPESFAVDTSRIGGADIESYYKAHPEEFSGPEEAKIAVILVPRKADESDFSAARERLRGVLDMARAEPDSFPSLARTYSDLQSAKVGGDPRIEPYLDALQPAVQKGLANVQPGQISDIIQDTQMLHIFQVDKRYPDPTTKREKIHYREIAVRVEPGSAAIRSARDLVTQISKEAGREGFGPVATKHGLRTFESQYFARGQSGNDILQRFPEIESWMFTAKVGSISHAVPTELGWYVFQIADRRANGIRPLDQMEPQVKAALIRSLRMEKAREAATAARAALQANESDEKVAAQFHGRALTADGMTRNGYIAPVGDREPRVAGALFTLPAGALSPVLTGVHGLYVFRIETHAAPSEEDFKKQEAQIREALLTEKRQVIFQEWMQGVRSKAKIKDYRENYFEA